MLHQMQINLPVMIHYFDVGSNLSALSAFLFSFLSHFSSFATSPISAFYFLSFFSLCAWCYTSPCAQHVRNEYDFCPAVTLFLPLASIIIAIGHIPFRFPYINWGFINYWSNCSPCYVINQIPFPGSQEVFYVDFRTEII